MIAGVRNEHRTIRGASHPCLPSVTGRYGKPREASLCVWARRDGRRHYRGIQWVRRGRRPAPAGDVADVARLRRRSEAVGPGGDRRRPATTVRQRSRPDRPGRRRHVVRIVRGRVPAGPAVRSCHRRCQQCWPGRGFDRVQRAARLRCSRRRQGLAPDHRRRPARRRVRRGVGASIRSRRLQRRQRCIAGRPHPDVDPARLFGRQGRRDHADEGGGAVQRSASSRYRRIVHLPRVRRHGPAQRRQAGRRRVHRGRVQRRHRPHRRRRHGHRRAPQRPPERARRPGVPEARSHRRHPTRT